MKRCPAQMHHGVVQQEKLARLLGQYLESGDETAVEQLVEEVRPRLLTVARRIGSPQDAEDTVQTALIALIRKRELDAPVMPWLVTAVIRIAYRRKAAERRQVDLARRLARGRDDPTPAAAAIGAERRELVRRDIARLPAKYRDAAFAPFGSTAETRRFPCVLLMLLRSFAGRRPLCRAVP